MRYKIEATRGSLERFKSILEPYHFDGVYIELRDLTELNDLIRVLGGVASTGNLDDVRGIVLYDSGPEMILEIYDSYRE